MKRLAILLLFAAAVAGCASAPTYEEFAGADYGSYPSNYEDIVRAYYGTILFDPYSAVITLSPPKQGWSGGGLGMSRLFGYVVCGTVNAKNRFGGYVGAEPFYIMIKDGRVIRAYDKYLADVACSKMQSNPSFAAAPRIETNTPNAATGAAGRPGFTLHFTDLTVNGVQPATPAFKAGLRDGDKLVRVGETTATPDNSIELYFSLFGDLESYCHITVAREGKEISMAFRRAPK